MEAFEVAMLALVFAVGLLVGAITNRPEVTGYVITATTENMERGNVSGVSIQIRVEGTGKLDQDALRKDITSRLFSEIDRRIMDKMMEDA